MVPEARKVAKELLKSHVVPPLDKSALQNGDEVIKVFEKSVSR